MNGDSIIKDINLAPEGEQKIEWVAQHAPVLNRLQAKYLSDPIRAGVKGIWNGTELASELREGDQAAVIMDRTNFYAEMGGQVGDSGELASTNGGLFAVDTTRVLGGYVLHVGNFDPTALLCRLDNGVNYGLAAHTIVEGGQAAAVPIHDSLDKGDILVVAERRSRFSHKGVAWGAGIGEKFTWHLYRL